MHTAACVIAIPEQPTFYVPTDTAWSMVDGKNINTTARTTEARKKEAAAKVRFLTTQMGLISSAVDFVHRFHDDNHTTKFLFVVWAKPGVVSHKLLRPTVIAVEKSPFNNLIGLVEQAVMGNLPPEQIFKHSWGT